MSTIAHHPLASLASVLFKNHFELQSLLDSLSQSARGAAGSPLQLGLRMGSTGGSMSIGRRGDDLSLEFSEQGRSYAVQMPLKLSTQEPFHINVTLEEGAEKKHFKFEGQTFWQAEMPESFRSLHERVVRYLKNILPANLRPSLETAAVATPEFRKLRVIRDDLPDFEFEGKQIGRVESVLKNGRQTALTVFKTKGGKLVGVREGITFWVGEQNRSQATVVENPEALVEFFGYTPIAKALYRQLGVSAAESIA